MSHPNEVIVIDLQMPFVSMVMLLVKWALASIPAIIILGHFDLRDEFDGRHNDNRFSLVITMPTPSKTIQSLIYAGKFE